MDPDAGVYASISKTMAQRNDYVNLWFQQTDWLDKPHFPFWITASFFKLFGYHDWAYKLPGILFVLLGAYYTFLFAKKYYNTTIALWSAFILLTAMHIIISNNDVRAEPFLTGLIIAAVYHFSNSLSGRWGRQLVAACIFSACAVMTKGIFTLIPIGGAVVGELILKRNWEQLFHWKWIAALVLLVIFISPELYCLWKQFDTQSEKTVLGSRNVSGIRFFLWDSQFGRFFNTGPIKGKGDKLFFLHTLLWAFLPWALLMYAALFVKIKTGIKKTNATFNESFTLFGSLLTLLLFSFSGFQLPHYTNIIFPMMSILTAHFIWQQSVSNKKVFTKIQNVHTVLLLVMAAGLGILYRPGMNVFTMFILFAAFVVLIFFRRFFNIEHAWLPYIRSGLAVLAIGLFLNLSFYPDLLHYQSGNMVAKYMNKNHPAESLGRAGIYFPSGEFYLRQLTHATTIDAIIKKEFTYARFLFLKEDELKKLEEAGILLEKIKEFDEFHVTMLTLKFINPKTRHKELRKHYLARPL
jgi:4-amino-4-deoxy-L-arabinose transferase-like glycosyltransferase